MNNIVQYDIIFWIYCYNLFFLIKLKKIRKFFPPNFLEISLLPFCDVLWRVGGKTGAGRLPPPLAGFPRYRLRLIYLSCSLCWFTCGRLDWNRSISSGDIPYSSSSSSSSSRSMRLRFNTFPTPPADTWPPVNFLSQLAPFSFLFPSSWNLAPWLWLSLQHPLYVPGRIYVWTK